MRPVEVTRNKTKRIVALAAASALAFCLLLTACSLGGEKLPVSDPEYSDYVGAWFRGATPWGGKLTVTIKSIVGGKMEWSLTDSFDNETLYREIEETEVKNGAASFDVQGNAAEDKDTSFRYKGTMELKDGAVVMAFEYGEIVKGSQESGASVWDEKRMADAGISNRVTLEKPDKSELNTYTVQSGDSLHIIAEKYGVTTKELAIMNQTVIIETAKAHGYEFDDVIEYAKYLFVGEELVVPAA